MSDSGARAGCVPGLHTPSRTAHAAREGIPVVAFCYKAGPRSPLCSGWCRCLALPQYAGAAGAALMGEWAAITLQYRVKYYDVRSVL